MIVAIARPASVISLPYQYETVILAIDASGSMRAADVALTRIAAARAASRNFIAAQPRDTRIGVVAFAATASGSCRPDVESHDILAALDRIQLQKGTAIGSAILVSLKLIFPTLNWTCARPIRGLAAHGKPSAARRSTRR